MCGIIGYVGKKSASPILLEGLRRLEYRGYDSAGVAFLDDGDLLVRKKKGKIDEGLAPLLKAEPVAGNLGIGHTRWATHGAADRRKFPSAPRSIRQDRRRPQRRHRKLRSRSSNNLLEAGPLFQSGTDTEVLAHLIGEYYEQASTAKNSGDAASARRKPFAMRLREVIGTYGLAVICARLAGHDRRRAARFAAHHRHRQRRTFSRQRRQRHRRAHEARSFI